jgi:branched-chain amino acid transport system substrate-binding protein
MPQWLSRHKWLWIVAAVLVALFVFAACDDDEEDGTTATVPCEGGPGPGSGEPLKIGSLMALTGGLAAYGPTIGNGAELAAKCINNAGGVNGGPLELIEEDTGSLAETGTAAAEGMVAEGVVAFVGPLGSDVTLGVASAVAIPNKILLITPSTTGHVLTVLEDDDFVFRTTISDDAQGVVLAQLVEEDLGFDSVCTMYVNNAYGVGLNDTFVDAYAGTVTAAKAHAEKGDDFLGELTECVAGDPEALIAMSYTTSQADVYLKQALENDLIDTFVFVDGSKDEEVFANLGWENFDGMFGTNPGALKTASGDLFKEMYLGEYGEEFTLPFVGEAFDAVAAIALAAEKAGTNTDSTAIRDALRDVVNTPGTEYGPGEDDIAAALAAIANGEDIDYLGASGAAEFDDVGDVTFGGIQVWKIEGEEVVTVRTVSVDLVTGEVKTIE